MNLEDSKSKKNIEVLIVASPKRIHLLKYLFLSLIIGTNKYFVRRVLVAPLKESRSLINVLKQAKRLLEYHKIQLEVVHACTLKDPLGFCRQQLLRHAEGPYVSIVDDDVLFTPSWAEGVLEAFCSECDIVFGALRPPRFYLEKQIISPFMPRYIIRSATIYNELFLCNDTSYIYGDIYEIRPRNPRNIIQCTQGLWGANMNFKLNIIRQLGGFRSLGYVKNKPIGGDDTELCVKAFLRKFRVCYSTKARLIHVVDPQKVNRRYTLLKYSTITQVFRDLQPRLEVKTLQGYINSWFYELANIIRTSASQSKLTDILLHLSIPLTNTLIAKLFKISKIWS